MLAKVFDQALASAIVFSERARAQFAIFEERLLVTEVDIGNIAQRGAFRLLFTRNATGQKLILLPKPLVESGLRIVDLAEEDDAAAHLLASAPGGVRGQGKMRIRLCGLVMARAPTAGRIDHVKFSRSCLAP